MSRPEPTGENRIVEPEEIFFSTTDAKGVIEKANSVFVDISRYSWDDLIGAPHNIIRHPMMPGAAFLAMWTTIKTGLNEGILISDGPLPTRSSRSTGEPIMTVVMVPVNGKLLVDWNATVRANNSPLPPLPSHR